MATDVSAPRQGMVNAGAYFLCEPMEFVGKGRVNAAIAIARQKLFPIVIRMFTWNYFLLSRTPRPCAYGKLRSPHPYLFSAPLAKIGAST